MNKFSFWLAATFLALLCPVQMSHGNPAPLSEPSTEAAPQPTPSPVVPFEKLMALLPEAPTGWSAEKPTGSTAEMDGFKLSTATRIYQKGDADDAPVVTVTLIDAGGHPSYFDLTTSSWKNETKTAEGYDKPVEIDGMPGFEHYAKASNTSSLSVIVAKRFFIQIECTNGEQKELREWLKKIDVKKLAALK